MNASPPTPGHPRTHLLLGLLAPLFFAAQARSQVELKPVEPMVGDVGPISVSLREVQADMRSPTGFEQVYRVTAADEILVRANGALYAVFPESIYEASSEGPVPVITSQTQFFIGQDRLEQWMEEQELLRGERTVPRTDARQSTIVNLRRVERPLDMLRTTTLRVVTLDALDAERRGTSPAPTARGSSRAVPLPPATLPAIVGDAAYRSRRIAELMSIAAAATP